MKNRRISALLIVIALLIAPVPTALAAGEVTYHYWDTVTEAWAIGTTTDAPTEITGSSSGGVIGTASQTTWYYVTGNVTITGGTLTVEGNVHIILADDSTLNITCATATPGITITAGSSLTIYADANGTSLNGKVTVTNESDSTPCIAIAYGGSLVLHGVELVVDADNYNPVIGPSSAPEPDTYGVESGAAPQYSATFQMFGGHLTFTKKNLIQHVSVLGVDGTEVPLPAISKTVAVKDQNGSPLANVVITASYTHTTNETHHEFKFCTDNLGRAAVFTNQDHMNGNLTQVKFDLNGYLPETPAFSVLDAADHEDSEALDLPATVTLTPWIKSVTPSGSNVPISTTELSITFSMTMNGNNSGDVVKLNGTPLSKSTTPWSGKTVTYNLPALTYNTTYNITIEGFQRDNANPMSYTDTTYSFVTESAPPGPDPQPNTQPNPNPAIKLDPEDLDKLMQNKPDGVMLYIVEGDLESLKLDIPLSWFVENLGATLLIYNEGLGLMAITSENMMELAAQAYNGEKGGVTITINGKQITFLPDTIISYQMVRGSIVLTVTADGNSMKWYVYDSPLILGIPNAKYENINEDWLVAFRHTNNGKEKIIPQSIVRDGIVYMLVSSEGHFDIVYNPIEFEDVSGWMEDAVGFVAARGIMNGIGDGLFNPTGNITRAQYVTMLMRMLDYEMTGYPENPFSDIDSADYYCDSVCKAAALGIVKGIGGGLFAPNAELTRQDIFTMTYRALVHFWMLQPTEPAGGDPDPFDNFSDRGSISPYALEAMTELVRTGLIQGGGEMLYPNENMTRAEAAQLMANIINCTIPDYKQNLNEQN